MGKAFKVSRGLVFVEGSLGKSSRNPSGRVLSSFLHCWSPAGAHSSVSHSPICTAEIQSHLIPLSVLWRLRSYHNVCPIYTAKTYHNHYPLRVYYKLNLFFRLSTPLRPYHNPYLLSKSLRPYPSTCTAKTLALYLHREDPIPLSAPLRPDPSIYTAQTLSLYLYR